MRIGIIHLTDLHIKDSKNWLDDKISNIVTALRSDFIDTEKVYIVISGDIANRGIGYLYAEQFLIKLKKSLERFNENILFCFIIVPGNHDCNFTEADQVRQIIIQNVDRTDYSDDNSVIDVCLKVQSDFWIFYEKLIGNLPDNRLVYQIKDVIGDKYIGFNCYNTAWMSSEKEVVGKMFFPVNKIQNIANEGNILTFSVFHHPLSWFTPNTDPNNRKEFGQYLDKSSQMLIYGHEHEEEHTKMLDIKTNKETVYISGRALQNDKDNSSGFKSISIDIINKTGCIKEYIWKKDLFVCNQENPFSINGAENIEKKFKPNTIFSQKIDEVNLPLKFESRKNVKLSDIYVYPDLEKISTKDKKIDETYNARRLFENSETDIVSLEGDAQAGKTSLLGMLYLNFLELDKYPILIEAKELIKYNNTKTIKKCFVGQYDNDDYDMFHQYDIDKKVLLIDNLQDYTHNAQSLIRIINELRLQFGKIIIGTSTIFSFSSALNAEFKNIDYFIIQPLGYKKRNELIEKYHILNESPLTITDQIILEKTKFHFDQIQTVLGNKLIPSYPVYVLSILQTLIYATPHNLEQTSLGYCYQSLLYVALADKAKIKNDDIDSYFNFLSELAFNLYQTKRDSFSDQYLNDFYHLYEKKYLSKKLISIKETLLLSNIIVEDGDGDYKFKYNYIFYFLISRKLVDLIHDDEGKKIITELCNNLSDEKSANILILTTHHTKDNYLIDEATFALMTPYDSYAPITLDIDDAYYNQIEEIVREISSNIIQSNRNPNEERQKTLEANDRINGHLANNKVSTEEIKKENEELSKVVEEMIHAIKSIEIVGQIVKNRKGSIDKEKLKNIITELYNTAFRTITFYGEMSKLTLDELMNSLKTKVSADDTNLEIERKIGKFFQIMTFQQCLAIFSKIIYSVGNKDLKELFDEVAKEMNTPASKLVTFSIKSCYGKLSNKELKELANEFKDNHVVLSILRSRVRAYVYNNHIDYREKQQIANTMKMKMLN